MHSPQFTSTFCSICFLFSATAFAADVPELNKDTFAKWRDFIRPSEKELEYRKIPWRLSLGPAIAEAHAKNKPIFLWNYNGNPFGCGCYNGVITRDVVGDKKIQELCENFVPVSECSWRLDVEKKYPGHEFFRSAYPKGGQGMYVLSPSGKLLGRSGGELENVSRLLQTSLKEWNELSPAEKSGIAKSGGSKPEDKLYPSNGLVLHTYVRDLPHFTVKRDGPQWNQDFAWFQKDEARQFLPQVVKADKAHEVPQFIVHRLARFHLLDNVHGGTWHFEENEVKNARLSSHITSIKDGIANVDFDGETRTESEGKWAIKERESPTQQRRGFSARLIGYAQYSVSQQKFISFELVACGTRWGATETNFRTNLDESPMGVLMVLAGKEPGERLRPMFLDKYSVQINQKLTGKK